ncbi:MAG TPA: hypothetical protein VKA27_01305, partial [Sunxiuqinia sp.]|nr:hypothetical protein [Sunxiuqinia sp.]
MSRFYISTFATLLITIGFITFLILTVINRWDDVYYRINNLSIGIVTLVALVSELFSLNTFRKKQSGFSLKEWLEKSISLINKDLKQRISYYIIPFIAVPTILSIHV